MSVWLTDLIYNSWLLIRLVAVEELIRVDSYSAMSSLITSSPGVAPVTITARTCDEPPPIYSSDDEHRDTAMDDDDSVDVRQVPPVVVLDASQRRRSLQSSAAAERQWTKRMSPPLVVQSVLPPFGHSGLATNEPYVFTRTQMNAPFAVSTATTSALLTSNRGRADELSRRPFDPGCCRRWNRDAQWPIVSMMETQSGRERRSSNTSCPHHAGYDDPTFGFPSLSIEVATTSTDDCKNTPSLTVTPSSPVHGVERPAGSINATAAVHVFARRHSATFGQLPHARYLEAIAEETSIARVSGSLGFDSATGGQVPSTESPMLAFRRHSHQWC